MGTINKGDSRPPNVDNGKTIISSVIMQRERHGQGVQISTLSRPNKTVDSIIRTNREEEGQLGKIQEVREVRVKLEVMAEGGEITDQPNTGHPTIRTRGVVLT